MNNSQQLLSLNINSQNNLKTVSNDSELEFDFSLCHYDCWLYSC
jgi:hypothetical protein